MLTCAVVKHDPFSKPGRPSYDAVLAEFNATNGKSWSTHDILSRVRALEDRLVNDVVFFVADATNAETNSVRALVTQILALKKAGLAVKVGAVDVAMRL